MKTNIEVHMKHILIQSKCKIVKTNLKQTSARQREPGLTNSFIGNKLMGLFQRVFLFVSS